MRMVQMVQRLSLPRCTRTIVPQPTSCFSSRDAARHATRPQSSNGVETTTNEIRRRAHQPQAAPPPTRMDVLLRAGRRGPRTPHSLAIAMGKIGSKLISRTARLPVEPHAVTQSCRLSDPCEYGVKSTSANVALSVESRPIPSPPCSTHVARPIGTAIGNSEPLVTYLCWWYEQLV